MILTFEIEIVVCYCTFDAKIYLCTQTEPISQITIRNAFNRFNL